jgi:NAD(P)-dependent dehydrogenase (short-subunit alcohol dehydrogenase family)
MSLLERFRLDGKVAIVTGASSGLGVAFAEGLAEAGADVVVCARRVDRLEETRARVEATGRRCVAVPADVAKPEDATRVVQAAMDELGRVDVLVNNAGIGTAVPATRETPDQFRQVIDINLNGSYWFAQAFGRAAKDGGAIVNIGSVLGSTTAGLPQAAYAASKAAIIGLTRDLAQQWTGRKGIRVNALAPGFFPSEMTDEFPEGYLDHDDVADPGGPHGRPGRADRRAPLPRQRRVLVRDRRRAARRRGHAHDVGWSRCAAATASPVTTTATCPGGFGLPNGPPRELLGRANVAPSEPVLAIGPGGTVVPARWGLAPPREGPRR